MEQTSRVFSLYVRLPAHRPHRIAASRCVVAVVLSIVRGRPVSRRMVLTTSQQVALAFTAVLFTFVAVPRMFGVGTGAKETRVDPRYTKKGREAALCCRGKGHTAKREHVCNLHDTQHAKIPSEDAARGRVARLRAARQRVMVR